MRQTRALESVSINIRAKARQRDLIDQEAENVLLDQTFFSVDAGTFARFQALLDRPLPPTDRLRRLLKTPVPWEG